MKLEHSNCLAFLSPKEMLCSTDSCRGETLENERRHCCRGRKIIISSSVTGFDMCGLQDSKTAQKNSWFYYPTIPNVSPPFHLPPCAARCRSQGDFLALRHATWAAQHAHSAPPHGRVWKSWLWKKSQWSEVFSYQLPTPIFESSGICTVSKLITFKKASPKSCPDALKPPEFPSD